MINNNKCSYCYIKPFHHPDDFAHYSLLRVIANDDLLTVVTVDNFSYLAFKSY